MQLVAIWIYIHKHVHVHACTCIYTLHMHLFIRMPCLVQFCVYSSYSTAEGYTCMFMFMCIVYSLVSFLIV